MTLKFVNLFNKPIKSEITQIKPIYCTVEHLQIYSMPFVLIENIIFYKN